MKILLALALITLFTIGCGSTAKNGDSATIETNTHSGFLSDYGMLEKVKSKDESVLMRYISPELKKRAYTQVVLDPVSFYPAPKPSDNISASVLKEISNYANQSFSAAIKSSTNLSTQANENAIRIKLAITGVSIVDKELAAYQYIPIAFLANAATGGLSEMVVNFQIEAEIIDSLTGEVLALATKSGLGETLKDDKTPLSLENIKPLIDSWAKTMQVTLKDNL